MAVSDGREREAHVFEQPLNAPLQLLRERGVGQSDGRPKALIGPMLACGVEAEGVLTARKRFAVVVLAVGFGQGWRIGIVALVCVAVGWTTFGVLSYSRPSRLERLVRRDYGRVEDLLYGGNVSCHRRGSDGLSLCTIKHGSSVADQACVNQWLLPRVQSFAAPGMDRQLAATLAGILRGP